MAGADVSSTFGPKKTTATAPNATMIAANLTARSAEPETRSTVKCSRARATRLRSPAACPTAGESIHPPQRLDGASVYFPRLAAETYLGGSFALVAVVAVLAWGAWRLRAVLLPEWSGPPARVDPEPLFDTRELSLIGASGWLAGDAEWQERFARFAELQGKADSGTVALFVRPLEESR